MPPEPPDLLSAFHDAAARFGPRTAIVERDGHAVSYADLSARITALAAGWHARGIGKGDRLLLAMPISADLYAALAALWALGATAVLPEPAMGLRGVRAALRATDCKGLVATGRYAWLKLLLPALWAKPLLRPRPGPVAGFAPHTPAAEEIALISFTSGSTGQPKAIARSHAFLQAQKRAIAPLLSSAAPERDLVAFPVFTLINLAAGRISVLPNWPMTKLHELAPQALANWITTQRVTRALLPPALCEALADAPPCPDLRAVFTGGGPVFPDLLARLQQAQPQLGVTCVYGSTEAEPIAHLQAGDISADDLAAMKAGNGLLAGRPVPEVTLRLEDGEILVAGAHVNSGYLNPAQDAESKLREGGVIWHRTGDAGRLDAAGRLWLLGRWGPGQAAPLPFQVEVAARFWPGVRRAALGTRNGQPVLAIEGDSAHLPDWQARAATDFGLRDVRALARIPMDTRHRSKVDHARLRQLLQ